MAELTNDQKIQVIQTHIQSVVYNQFNLEISILEERAKTNPDQTTVTNLIAQSADCDKQLAVLEAQLAPLQAAVAKATA